MEIDIDLLTASSARTAVEQRQVTATTLAESFTPRSRRKIARFTPYLTLSKDRAFAQAAKIDALADKGDPLPPLGRRAHRDQGRDGHQGRSHHGRLKDP